MAEPTPIEGLSDAEAARRLSHFGFNELPRQNRRGVFCIAAETMREPMFALLAAAASLYLMIGDLGEGLFLFAGAMASIGLVILQETRSENALDALRDLAQPYVRVIRGDAERRVAARDLVPGDLFLIGEGERVPADGLLVSGQVLNVDESVLTGESAPVSKRLARRDETFPDTATPGEEGTPLLFTGAMVISGQALIRAARTGVQSTMGRIGESLRAIDHEPTPLQRTAGKLLAYLGASALAFCALLALAYGLMRGDWVGGALSGITVAISLIPEEFPMILAVFLALGAWRLARRNVLVRRSAAIETLGGTTILCVDKTGTITENRMRIARLWRRGASIEALNEPSLDAESADLIACAARASALRPVDPMDRAIRQVFENGDKDKARPEHSWGLRPELMAVVQAWRRDGDGYDLAAKGAPEAIFRLCRLSAEEGAALHAVVEQFAEDGLRVLGVASCAVDGRLPDAPERLAFSFAGLVGFLDPLRSDVPAALCEAESAGIGVLMITGDHPATARAIARSAGLRVERGILLGPEIARMSDEDLRVRLKDVRVCARVAPEQKLRIVEALKADGEIVAMTGDGVNDAPALEAAHVGVAMGRRGTDVAREASDLILLDDSFASIVGGVRLGRRIFTNLRKALTYVTAVHVPIAGLALAPIVFGMPPLLFPMHVVLLELAIDPICALAFEGERSADNAMRVPPRRADQPLFGPNQVIDAVIQGGVIFLCCFWLYWWSLAHMPETEARATAFVALVGANLVLAFVDAVGVEGRVIDGRRGAFWIIAGMLIVILACAIAAPPLAALFRMAAPDAAPLSIALAIAAGAGAWRWTIARLHGVAARDV
jgi:Ca2+-transporting ATPase